MNTIDFAEARRAMVDCQIRPSDVTRYGLIEAMLWAPREKFVPRTRRDVAYAGAEVQIAPGRAMLEPRLFAKMVETAQIGQDSLVLDIASGTGYSTAILSRLAEAVVAIEPDAGLAEAAQKTLADLEVDNAAVAVGDPAKGDAAHGPYDVIFINGAVEVLPKTLTDQMKQGGRLIAVFAKRGAGQCRLLTRSGDTLTDLYVFDASAPLLPGFERPQGFEF